MAEEKKSFILYCDIIHTIEKLTDEESGKLFKHILKYVNDMDPIADDILTDIVFEPIKQSLKRDLLKFKDKKLKFSEAGKKGSEKRWGNKDNNNHPITNDNHPIKVITEIAVSDSVSVSVSDSVSDNTISVNNKTIGGWEKVVELFPPTKHSGLIEAAITWNELDQKEKQNVMRHLNPYLKNTEPQFVKQIGNYFNERLWEKMKSKPSTSKMKMLDYNFIEWVKKEFDFQRFDEARTFLSKLQVEEVEQFNEINKEYKLKTKN